MFGKKCKEDVLLPLSFLVVPIIQPFLPESSGEETEFLMPSKVIQPKYYKNICRSAYMNVVLLLLMCRFDRIGSTEDFFNFAIMYPTFEGVFKCSRAKQSQNYSFCTLTSTLKNL